MTLFVEIRKRGDRMKVRKHPRIEKKLKTIQKNKRSLTLEELAFIKASESLKSQYHV